MKTFVHKISSDTTIGKINLTPEVVNMVDSTYSSALQIIMDKKKENSILVLGVDVKIYLIFRGDGYDFSTP